MVAEPDFALLNFLVWVVPSVAFFLSITIKAFLRKESPLWEMLLGVPVYVVGVLSFIFLFHRSLSTSLLSYLVGLGIIIEHGVFVPRLLIGVRQLPSEEPHPESSRPSLSSYLSALYKQDFLLDASGWSWYTFAWGAAGAAAPEILRIYNIVTGGASGSLPKFGRVYFLISIAFVALGGAFAVAWAEHNAFKCLWVGMSLPVVISAFASQLRANSDDKPTSSPPSSS